MTYQPIRDIKPNRDLPNEGMTDPNPELGRGSLRRRWWSAIKGIFTTEPVSKPTDDVGKKPPRQP